MLTAIHFPASNAQRQTTDAIVAAIKASAAALAKSAEKASAKHESFGQQLALAIKAKLHPPQPHFIAESAPEESFGEQIKKAVEKKQGGLPTQKQHKERVEREERYKEQAERARKWYFWPGHRQD